MEKITMKDKKEDILRRYEELVSDYESLVSANVDLTEKIKEIHKDFCDQQHELTTTQSDNDVLRNRIKAMNAEVESIRRKLSLSYIVDAIFIVALLVSFILQK